MKDYIEPEYTQSATDMMWNDYNYHVNYVIRQH